MVGARGVLGGRHGGWSGGVGVDFMVGAMGVSTQTSWWVQWGCRGGLHGQCNGGVGADFMVDVIGVSGRTSWWV